MTVAEFIVKIKREHKQTTSSLDSFILDLINEGLASYAKKHRYQELLVLDASVSASVGSGTFALPENYCNLESNTVFFYRSSTEFWKLFKPVRNSQSTQGIPSRFRVGSGSIQVSPYSDILSTDHLQFNYYKLPDAIEDTGDDFPVLSLEDVVKQFVLARLALFDDSKIYAAKRSIENERFVDSIGND